METIIKLDCLGFKLRFLQGFIKEVRFKVEFIEQFFFKEKKKIKNINFTILN